MKLLDDIIPGLLFHVRRPKDACQLDWICSDIFESCSNLINSQGAGCLLPPAMFSLGDPTTIAHRICCLCMREALACNAANSYRATCLIQSQYTDLCQSSFQRKNCEVSYMEVLVHGFILARMCLNWWKHFLQKPCLRPRRYLEPCNLGSTRLRPLALP